VIAEVRELTIQYGKRVAVDALDLSLAAGEIALLLGPNGAGKSTTLAAIAGTVMPSAGTIAIDGENLATAPRTARAKVGFADQPPALYEYFTVEEHVGFIAEDVPELVATPNRKGLSSMDIVGVLTKVVQEQQNAIKEPCQGLARIEATEK